MTSLTSLTLDASDADAAAAFYTALALDDRIAVRESREQTSGFRGFTISLLVSQPSNATALFDAATAAGATVLKPISKSLWGVGGVVRAPDGAILKFATSAKKDSAPASTAVDSVVVLVAASDVGTTKKFYVDRGFTVGKSFGKYVEFALPGSPIGFGLYSTKALAKDAGVAPEGSGPHGIVLNGDAGSFVDPDGFAWRS